MVPEESRSNCRREAEVDGRRIGPGSRVRIRPARSQDVFDLLLTGRTATVESVEEDGEGILYLALTVDDDPGRDWGQARLIGHRFFYRADEVEPL
ncbi:protein of unknown function [Candidatus Hydrogenisulfobacillus filiaventi]|uniref:Uncharacterized protein n=1 Tax=Candidatus Hydrogenisulfobacillus filiaventi TaxID=2707344 RepID=A0A6F8ZIZ9_9FIRM|nr:hypothetical protein [Bacillota bacterium]CAB1129768.1 protein of unknown function [Candidatus Hydrogenisulfobacillus filiaventi]